MALFASGVAISRVDLTGKWILESFASSSKARI